MCVSFAVSMRRRLRCSIDLQTLRCAKEETLQRSLNLVKCRRLANAQTHTHKKSTIDAIIRIFFATARYVLHSS